MGVSKKGRGRWRKGSTDGALTLLAPLLPQRIAAALSSGTAAVVAFALASVVELALCVVLFGALHRWRFEGGVLRVFGHAVSNVSSDAADLVLLSLTRTVLLSLLSALSFRVATKRAPKPAPAAEGVDSLRAPLLDEESPPAECPPAAAAPPSPLAGVADPHKRAKKAAKAAAKARAAAAASVGDAAGRRAKTALQLLAYLLCSACQIYVGSKAVLLPRDGPVAEVPLAALLLGIVTLAHVQQAAAASAVDARVSAAWARDGGASPPADDGVASVLRTDAGPVVHRHLSAGHYLWWCLSLVRAHAWSVSLGFVALLFGNACDLALPRIAGAALDAAVHRDGAAFAAALKASAGLQAAAGAAGGVRGICFATAAAHLLASLSVRLYGALLRQDIAFFDAAATGDLLSRLTEDAKAATDPANWIMSALGRALLQALGGALLCAHISWRLTLLAGAATGPVYALTTAYATYSATLQRARSEALGAAAAAAADSLGNVRLVRACSCERAEAARYAALASSARDLGLRDARGYALTLALNEWVNLAASLILLAVGGHMVMRRELSVGALVAFQVYFGKIDASWQSTLQFLQSLTSAAGAAERVVSVLELKPRIGSRGGNADYDDDSDAGPAPDMAPASDPFTPGALELCLRDVCFAYQQRPGSLVLRGFSLNVPAGGVAALVGRSGSGKSTVVSLLMRFYDPQAGQIWLGGAPLTSTSPESLHAAVALVAQDAPVFASSILENIRYGCPPQRASMQAVRDAAAQAAALSFIDGFDSGFETLVGERGVRLSAGQKQRIALARALLRAPRLLLADEATASLDAESEREVQAALDAAIATGRQTVLLVAHRLSTVRDAGTIAVCADGRVVECGTHEELIALGKAKGVASASDGAFAPGVYARLVARQLDGARRLEAPSAQAAASELERAQAAAAAAAAVVGVAGGEIEALLS